MSASNTAKTEHFNDATATFGDRLEAARLAKGLTVNGLAEKLGVEVGRIEAWESDADAPRASRIQLLAGLLNVSIVWLICGEGNGTLNVANTYERPEGVNDALGEIAQVQVTLAGVVEKLAQLEQRLRDID